VKILAENKHIAAFRTNYVVQALMTCESVKEIENVLDIAVRKLDLTQRQLSVMIYERISSADSADFQMLVLKYPSHLFFPFLCSESHQTSIWMETGVMHLFPGFCPLSHFEIAEVLLDSGTTRRTSINETAGLVDIYDQDRNDCLNVDEADMRRFNRFFLNIVSYIREIFPLPKSTVHDGYARLIRVLHWMILWLKGYVRDTELEVIFEFTRQVKQAVSAPNCNLVELLRAFDAISEPMRHVFLEKHSDEFIRIFFPMECIEYPKFHKTIFLLFFSVFKNVIDCCSILADDDVSRSFTHFLRLNEDMALEKFVKYVMSGPGMQKGRESRAVLLEVTVRHLNEQDSLQTGLMLLSGVLPFMNEILDSDTFTCIIKWFLSQFEDRPSLRDDFHIVGRFASACQAICGVAAVKKLSRSDVFESKVRVVLDFLILHGQFQYRTQHSVVGYGQSMIREGIGSFLLQFAKQYPGVNNAVIESICDILDNETINLTSLGFWALQYIFCSCLLNIKDSAERFERIRQEFPRMLDFVTLLTVPDVKKTFKILASLIALDGYEKHDAWAAPLYCMVLSAAVNWDSVECFMKSVVANCTEDCVTGAFVQIAALISVREKENLAENIEKAAMFLTTRPELRRQMLSAGPIDAKVFEFWPKEVNNLMHLFKLDD
jgi:hypothetical protein